MRNILTGMLLGAALMCGGWIAAEDMSPNNFKPPEAVYPWSKTSSLSPGDRVRVVLNENVVFDKYVPATYTDSESGTTYDVDSADTTITLFADFNLSAQE
jgi:hypothetical protein